MSFALKNRLAECLAEKEIRQWQLARRLHMSRAYVCRLCSGQIQPSMVAALRIALCVGKPIEQIFQLVEEDTKQGNFPVVRVGVGAFVKGDAKQITIKQEKK